MNKSTQLNLIYDKDNKPSDGEKFIALYNDGSGASLFQMKENEKIIDTDGVEYSDYEVLPEAGYWYWLPIPDDYKFWYEKE